MNKKSSVKYPPVTIIDAPCGIGKTTAAINMINESVSNKKFLYITPYKEEVKRIKEACKSKKMKEPEKYETKIEGIKYLFSKGFNIVSTHSLFSRFNESVIDITKLQDYTLIMDEVAEVVTVLDITKDDLRTILEKYAHIDSTGVLIWDAKEYEGKFDPYKKLCEAKCVSVYGSENSKTVFLWTFPVNVFKAFKEIYILTYMFDGQIQRSYYDYYDIKYEYKYVKDFHITDKEQYYDISKYKELVTILDNDKLNEIGNSKEALSSSWYHKNAGTILTKVLKNNCINFFKNITKTPSGLNLWTTFKDYKNEIKGDSYTKSFVSLNMRATNDYSNRASIAYTVNRFMMPCIKNFFLSRGIRVDENKFALSEIIQFIFRSRVRNGEPIIVYIPSSRMRKLFSDWLYNGEVNP